MWSLMYWNSINGFSLGFLEAKEEQRLCPFSSQLLTSSRLRTDCFPSSSPMHVNSLNAVTTCMPEFLGAWGKRIFCPK